MTQRSFTPLLRLTAIAALAIGSSMSSHAGGGEALDIEMPSMRTPIEATGTSTAVSSPAVGTYTTTTELATARDNTDVRANAVVERPLTISTARAPVARTGAAAPSAPRPVALPVDQAPLTRADVKEALRMARATNTMTPSGEIGDTTEVLQAREDFYALQTEVIRNEYAAAEQREMDARMAQQAFEQQRLLEQQAVQTQPLERDVADKPQVISQADAPTDSVIVESNMTIGEVARLLDDTGTEGAVVVVTEEQEAD